MHIETKWPDYKYPILGLYEPLRGVLIVGIGDVRDSTISSIAMPTLPL